MDVSRKFQGCLKKVTRVFQEIFKGVSRKFQRLFGKFQRVLVGFSDSWRFFEILSRVSAGFGRVLSSFGKFQ